MVTKIYKSQNPASETEEQRTFRYWYEQLYLTPRQKKALQQLEKISQYLFDLELFLESDGASIDEDSLLVQEPESVFIFVHTLSDPSVGIFPIDVITIRIKPDGQVDVMRGRRIEYFLEGFEPEDRAEFEKFIADLPSKLKV